jgi:hypothetical protein
VVLVEDAPSLGDIDAILGLLRPGQLDQPVEIGADHAVLGRGLGRALQPPQLLPGLFLHLVRHAGRVDRLAQLFQLRGRTLLLAELAADRLHLLAQEGLALALLQRGAGLIADLAREPQHAQAVGQELEHPVEPALEIEGLQHLLLLGRAQVHRAGDEIDQLRRRVDRADRVGDLAARLRQELDRFERALAQQYEARLDLGAALLGLLVDIDLGREERLAADELLDAEALLPLGDDVMVAVRRGDVAQDDRGRADAVQVDRRRVVGAGLALQDDADRPLGAHAGLRRGDRARTVHGQGHDRPGEQDHVAHGHDRQHVRRQRRRLARLGLRTRRSLGVRHCGLLAQASLRRVKVRQPSASSRRPIS